MTKAKRTKKKAVYQHGWLSPEGKFVKTCYTGHCETADEIIADKYPDKKNTEDPSYFLEKNGWMKLSAGRWYGMGNEPTQSQLDYIFDWCLERGVTYPLTYQI